MQTDYKDNFTLSAGELGYSPDDRSVSSYFSNEEIAWGVAVVRAAGNDFEIKAPTLSTEDILGVSVVTKATENSLYTVGDAIPVLSRGSVCVAVDGDVTPDDPVYFRFAAEPHVVDLVFAGLPFVVGNVINASVGGASIVPVVFNTDDATTLLDLASAIQALTTVSTAVSNGVDTITITGSENGVSILASAVVTGGASQPTATASTVSGPSASAILGAFRADDGDTGNGPTATLVESARWVKSNENSVALLDINLP